MFEAERLALRARLQQQANAKTKTWWENYVKDSAPFLGVKMPTIRSIVHDWYGEQVEGKLDLAQQFDLALALFAGEYTEEKLAATLLLQEILLPQRAVNCASDIDRFAALFQDGWIYDWNTCDWFCVKVLGPLIEENGWECAAPIAAWRDAENLWQARASLVAFVKVAGDSAYYPAIAASCQALIRRPERFAKTAVGWILREISRHDEPFVRQALEENIQHFSPESLKNATKYFDTDARAHYRQLLAKA